MPLHLLVKWEVVSPNSREGQLESIYPLYPLFPCSYFVSQMWGWFGGGGGNVFLTFLAPLCHLAAELFKCRLVRRRRRRRRRRCRRRRPQL